MYMIFVKIRLIMISLTCFTTFVMITKNGYARLKNSHTSTGLMLGVLGREVDTDKYMDASTIKLVMFMVKIMSYAESPVI